MIESKNYSVDIIIPIRTRDDYDIFDRLELRALYNLPNNFQFVIVNDGSNKKDSNRIEKICNRLGFKYFFIDSQNQILYDQANQDIAVKNGFFYAWMLIPAILLTLSFVAMIFFPLDGKKWNEETKRFDYGNYPLYEIISSHVCRRSFATHNYAKIPTPIIMAVTGHKTEKEFLNYIGKDYNDLSREMLTYWKKEKETAEPQQKNKTAN